MQRITIIGDGAMGTLSALLLSENGCRVRLWSAFPDQAREMDATRVNPRFLPGVKIPEQVEITGQCEGVFDEAHWVVSAVPTQYIREVWQRLAPHCPAGLGISSVAKGIEKQTLLRPSQVIRDVLDGGDAQARAINVLSGPSIAPEIAHKLPATVVAASEDPEFARTVQEAYARSYFRVYTNDDPLGVELAGATKNVIAIAAGILDGLGAGDNAKAALLTRGLAEIARLGESMGAKPDTFAGLAGMGDLVTTCISPVGRNRSFGERIGKGVSVEEALAATDSVVEGEATCRGVVALAQEKAVDMPITQAIARVLFEGQTPREAIDDLMTRPLKAEGPL
jgi:glycerol-3-phosphate dehydrogenase (NAD(P)+)